MTLPKQYSYLLADNMPKMIKEAIKIYGTTEKEGPGNNPEIMKWAKEVGAKDYTADKIPWCGLAIAVVALRAGKKLVQHFLYALNWGGFGVPITEFDNIIIGDIVTLYRYDGQGKLIGGHVGLYVGHDATHVHLLGGNQGDQFNIRRMDRKRIAKIRRPAYSVKPAGAVHMPLSANGSPVSSNEA